MKRMSVRTVSLDPVERNLTRGQLAESILRTFQRETGVDREDLLCDLLANLMHWCDQNSFRFENELRRGLNHYRCEAAGEL